MTRGSLGRWCGNALAIGRLLPLYVALGALKRVVPVQTLARWAWRPPAGPPDPERVRRAVARVWRTQGLLNLGDHDCLQRSLLLYRELSRLGADPTLTIGFRHSAQHLQGHAWVTTPGEAVEVVAEPAGVTGYVAAIRFGRNGALEQPRESS